MTDTKDRNIIAQQVVSEAPSSGLPSLPTFHILHTPECSFRLNKLRHHLALRGFQRSEKAPSPIKEGTNRPEQNGDTPAYRIFPSVNGWHDVGYPPHLQSPKGATDIARSAPALSPGHYGNAAGKYDIIKRFGFGNDSTEPLFIGEDDVRFLPNAIHLLRKAIWFLNEFDQSTRGWEVLMLGAFALDVKNSKGVEVHPAGAKGITHIREADAFGLSLGYTENTNCHPAMLLRGERIQRLYCQWFESNSWEIGCGKLTENGEPCKNAFGEQRSVYTASDWALARICREYGIKQYMFDPPIATQIPGYSLSDLKDTNHNVNSAAFE